MDLRTVLDKLGIPTDGVDTAELDREVEVVIAGHRFDVFQVVTVPGGPVRLELQSGAVSPLWPDDRS